MVPPSGIEPLASPFCDYVLSDNEQDSPQSLDFLLAIELTFLRLPPSSLCTFPLFRGLRSGLA